VLEAPAVAAIFAHYMSEEKHPVSATALTINLAAKMKHAGFLSDTPPLLRPGLGFDYYQAHDWLVQELIPLIPYE